MTDTHTALPWWDESGVIHAANGRGGATHPASCDSDANAAYIVKAANAYPDLLAALEGIVRSAGYESGEAEPRLIELNVGLRYLDDARAAIEKATS